MATPEETVQAMQKEMADMKLRLAKVIATESTEPKIVFAPRERKITPFSGRKDEKQTVDEFIENVEMALKTRPTSDEEKVNFVMSLLEGPAREEIRYRPQSDRKKPSNVLAIIKETFGERGTVSELLAEFYQCKQIDGESIQDYSHKLMAKLNKVLKKDSKAIPDRDSAIKNQFAENVKLVWLKRELKKRLRSNPGIAFTDLREEANLLMEDAEDKNTEHPVADFDVPVLTTQAKSAESSEIKKLMAKLESIEEDLKVLKAEKQRPRYNSNPESRKCHYCDKIGHIKKDCRKLKRDNERKNLNGESLRQGAIP